MELYFNKWLFLWKDQIKNGGKVRLSTLGEEMPFRFAKTVTPTETENVQLSKVQSVAKRVLATFSDIGEIKYQKNILINRRMKNLKPVIRN
jgi:hypothetical protein